MQIHDHNLRIATSHLQVRSHHQQLWVSSRQLLVLDSYHASFCKNQAIGSWLPEIDVGLVVVVQGCEKVTELLSLCRKSKKIQKITPWHPHKKTKIGKLSFYYVTKNDNLPKAKSNIFMLN
jgi:hypothetical protein